MVAAVVVVVHHLVMEVVVGVLQFAWRQAAI
jgi:hypothetical protein